jgi:hypothetical protein
VRAGKEDEEEVAIGMADAPASAVSRGAKTREEPERTGVVICSKGSCHVLEEITKGII